MENSKEKKKSVKKREWIFLKKKKTKIKESVAELPKIYDLKDLLESKHINLKPRVNQNKVSRLCPTLLDILKKSVALGYFYEYLQEHDQKSLLDFWLEAETFRLITGIKYKRKAYRSDSVRSFTETNSSNDTTPLSPRRFHSSISLNCSQKDNSFDETQQNRQSCNGVTQDNIGLNNESFDSSLNKNFYTSSPKKIWNIDSKRNEFRERARTRSFIVDAVSIYSKYISLNADYPINLPSNIRNDIEAIICKDKNYLDPNCFVVAQEYIFEFLIKCREEFLRTHSMISYQLKTLESENLRLQDILYHDAILFYFTEFLDQQQSKQALEFYITAENFEEDTETKLLERTYNTEQVVNDAMHIYEKYFSMRCEYQLIQDDKLRIVLENNICREDGPQPNCFCIPMAYAWTALSEIYLPAFLASDVYKSYISHLKNMPSGTDELASCSSRSSMQSHDDFPLITHADSKSSILEDENGLEEFWFKPVHHQSTNRLALGHVNEYGVFSSDFENPFIDQPPNSVSKFGKAMKNLIRGETKEETEQLAWERAIKIIEEIQQQTQS